MAFRDEIGKDLQAGGDVVRIAGLTSYPWVGQVHRVSLL